MQLFSSASSTVCLNQLWFFFFCFCSLLTNNTLLLLLQLLCTLNFFFFLPCQDTRRRGSIIIIFFIIMKRKFAKRRMALCAIFPLGGVEGWLGVHSFPLDLRWPSAHQCACWRTGMRDRRVLIPAPSQAVTSFFGSMSPHPLPPSCPSTPSHLSLTVCESPVACKSQQPDGLLLAAAHKPVCVRRKSVSFYFFLLDKTQTLGEWWLCWW